MYCCAVLQGACVLFATPGMLHGGTSLEVFKAWAPDPKNLVLLPSYQVGVAPPTGPATTTAVQSIIGCMPMQQPSAYAECQEATGRHLPTDSPEVAFDGNNSGSSLMYV